MILEGCQKQIRTINASKLHKNNRKVSLITLSLIYVLYVKEYPII